MKIIPALHVTSESGTGLVHCAPAHGAEDYHAFRALNLLSSPNSMICHVDGEGKFSGGVTDILGSEVAREIEGKEVLGDGSRGVVKVLKRLDRLVKIKRIKHRYPYDWKTDKPIIVTYGSPHAGTRYILIVITVQHRNGSLVLTRSRTVLSKPFKRSRSTHHIVRPIHVLPDLPANSQRQLVTASNHSSTPALNGASLGNAFGASPFPLCTTYPPTPHT